jgi:hypothetical protein
MTTPDFRALCKELVDELQGYKVAYPMHCRALLNRARAALATPPPEPPTDEELMALAITVFNDHCATDKDYARAALEKWGHH